MNHAAWCKHLYDFYQRKHKEERKKRGCTCKEELQGETQ